MKRLFKLAAFSLSAFIFPVAGQEVSIGYGAGNMAAMLAYDADVYATAAAAALTAAVRAPSMKQIRALEAKTHGATIAIVEYRPPGWEHPIRIHSRSGRSNTSIIQRLGGLSDTSSGVTSTGESDLEAPFATPDDVASDAAEATYYPDEVSLREGFRPTAPVDIRAPLLDQPTGGVVEASIIGDGRNHAGDAEIKALRKLESLFIDSSVPQGGRITAYVSKTVCASCEAGFQAIADTYRLSVQVYQLDEVNTPSQAGLYDVLQSDITAASRASSTLLKTVRKSTTTERLRQRIDGAPRATWFDDVDLDHLAAAEAGSLSIRQCEQ
jgi:hypothetical protein